MRTKAMLLLLLLAAPARATFTLSLTTAGPVTPLAIVTSTPGGIVCPGICSAVFAASQTVVLGEIHPSTMAFGGWSGAQGCRSNGATCTLTLRSNAAVVANFNPMVRLSFAGDGVGSVNTSSSVDVNGGNFYGSPALVDLVYNVGDVALLTESTRSASAFAGWTGGFGCAAASTCTFTVNGSTAIVAHFAPDGVGPYRLAVTVPQGGGVVTSNPAGIVCPGVCSSTFTISQVVTLTTAAAAGYRFAGWANGGCAKNLPCVVSSTTPLQGLGGPQSPAAYFYRNAP